MARSVFRSNRGQLAQIQFVLDRSAPDDRMFDEWRDFNLFRPDMHYFWFMTRPGVRLYNRVTAAASPTTTCAGSSPTSGRDSRRTASDTWPPAGWQTSTARPRSTG